MPRGETVENKKARLKAWQGRVAAGNKIWERWDTIFPGDWYEGLYLGTANGGETDPAKRYERIFYNLTASDIELLKPMLVLQRPRVNLTVNPQRSDDQLSTLEELIPSFEAGANTVITDARTGFIPETQLAIHESFFRMGLIEVGYSNSPVDNPDAGKALLGEDGKELKDPETGEVLKQGEKIIREESIFFKRIPAKNWRFAPTSEWMLDRIPWYGYCEWIPLKDLQADKRLRNTSELKPGGKMAFSAGAEESDKDKEERKGAVLVWKLWDTVKKRKLWFADNAKDGFLLEEDYTYRQVACLRFYPILNEPYPKPVVSDWAPLQLEADEIREMQKIHRRRAKRRYLTKKGVLDDKEREKLESGPDCTVIELNAQLDSIRPLEDAPLDRAVQMAQQSNQRDFDQIARVSAEQRGVAGAGTATQANIMATSSKQGADYLRETVAAFLSDIVEIALKTMLDRMANPMWVRMAVDPISPAAQQNAMVEQQKWEKLKMSDLLAQYPGALDAFAWSVHVEVERAKGETSDLERDRLNAMLQNVFGNPTLAMILPRMPSVLKKLLAAYDLDSDRTMKEVVGVLMAVGAQGASPQPGKQGPPRPTGPGGPQRKNPPPAGAGTNAPNPAPASATSAQLGR